MWGGGNGQISPVPDSIHSLVGDKHNGIRLYNGPRKLDTNSVRYHPNQTSKERDASMKPMRRSTFAVRVGILFWLMVGTLPSVGAQNEEPIRSIRSEYKLINRADKRSTTVERVLPNYSEEGSILTGYYSGSVLRKIEAVFYGETGQAVEEFYFWHGRLIFVLRTDLFYNQPLGMAAARRTDVHGIRREQTRFYFNQGKLIRWLDANQTPVATEGITARNREHELLQDARTFISLLRSPANTTQE